MTESDITAIRDALAAGPTPGPWAFSDKVRNGIATVTSCEHIVVGPDYGKRENVCYDYHACGHVDAAYIAACHPERIARLLDALESATKDAERYRWLRNNANIKTPHIATPDGWKHYHLGADEIVDAAMQKEAP